MDLERGRAPKPKGGDPNVKAVKLSLHPQEWRSLRLWAAERGTTVPALVGELLRRALADARRDR